MLNGSAANTIGTLSISNTSSQANADSSTLSGTLNIVAADGTTHAITLGTIAGALNSTDTLQNLAASFGFGGVNASFGITATYNANAGATAGNVVFTATGSGASINTVSSNPGGTPSAGSDTVTLTGVPTTTLNIGTSGKTLAQVATAVNALTAQTGIIASTNATAVNGHAIGTVLTFTDSLGANGDQSVAITALQTLSDNIASVSKQTGLFGLAATLGSISVNNTGDTLGGVLNVVGADGTSSSIQLGIQSSTDTLANLATYITADAALGITATLNTAAVVNSNGTTVPANTVLTFTTTPGAANPPSITNNGIIYDTTAAELNNPVTVTPGGGDIGVLTAATANDILSGTLQVTNTSGTTTAYTYTGQTLLEIQASFNQPPGSPSSPYGSGVTAALTGNKLTFTGSGSNAVSGINFTDSTPASTVNASVATGTVLNTLTVTNSADLATGDFDIVEGANSAHTNIGAVAVNPGQTLQQIADDFNGVTGATQAALSAYGISAMLNSAKTQITFLPDAR